MFRKVKSLWQEALTVCSNLAGGGQQHKAIALLSVSLSLALISLTASAQTDPTSRTYPCRPAYSPPSSPFLPIWLEDWLFWLPSYSEQAWIEPFPPIKIEEEPSYNKESFDYLRLPWWPGPPPFCMPNWFPVPIPPPQDWTPPSSENEAIYLGSGTALVDGAGSVCGIPGESPLLMATGQTGFHLPMPATSFGHGGWVHLTSPTPGGTWLSQLYSWDRIQLVRVRSRAKGTPIENYRSGSIPDPHYEMVLYDASGTASRFVPRDGQWQPAFGVQARLIQNGDTFTVIGGPPWAINQKGAWRYGFTGMPRIEDGHPNQPWGSGDKAKVLFIRDPLGNTWQRVDSNDDSDNSYDYRDSIIWRAPNLTLLRFDSDGKIYYAENPTGSAPVWQELGRMNPLVVSTGHPVNQSMELVWYEPTEGEHIAFQWSGYLLHGGQVTVSRLQSGTLSSSGRFESQVELEWRFRKNLDGKEALLYQYLYGEPYSSTSYRGRLESERRGGYNSVFYRQNYLSNQAESEIQIWRDQMPPITRVIHRWNSGTDKFTEMEVRRPKLYNSAYDPNRTFEREVVVFSQQNGKPIERKFFAWENATTPEWTEQYRYEYASNPDVLTSFTDRQGNRYQWTYEEREALRWHPEVPQYETVLTSAVDPTGVSVQLRYGESWLDFYGSNPPLLPSSIQLGSNGRRVWRFQYSWNPDLSRPAPNGLLLGFSEPGRGWWQIGYTSASYRQPFQPNLFVDPTGRFSRIVSWDSLGRATRIESYPYRSQYGWDRNRPLYTEVEYTRFGLVRAVRTGYANFSPQEARYEWEGLQLKQYTDPRGRTVRFEYRPSSGDLERIYIGNRLYAQLGYDYWGRLERVAGGNNVGVSYQYGYRDELIAIRHDGDSQGERFDYSSCCGQVSRWERQDGQEVRFDYTPNGWLREVYKPRGLGERERLAYYEYDSAGRLTLAQDALSTRRFTYDTTDDDRTGWLERSSVQFANGTSYQWDYTYYLSGDVQQVRLTGSWLFGGSSQSFVYDEAGRLTTHTYGRSGVSLTIRYEYDGAGRITQQTVQVQQGQQSASLQTTIGYQDSQSVGSIGWFNTYLNNLQIASFSYEYYPDGTVRRATETIGQGGRPRTWEWDYYEDGSLKYESASHLGRRDYSYDLGGNLNAVPAQMNIPASYEYNKLMSIGNWRFAYTPNGERSEEWNNPVSGNWAYRYDVWGNLIWASRNGQVVYEAQYDAFGNRVWARFLGANGIQQRYYLYEGDTLVAELDEYGNLVAEYVWGQLGPVARIERVPSWPIWTYRVQLYVLDGLGHVRGLVGSDSAGVWRYEETYDYDSWGNLLNSGVPSQPFLWNGAYGYEYIPATGLYHVGAREYDPRTARWLQRDPIDVASGDPNLYRYCRNDPINGWDDGGEQTRRKSLQTQQNRHHSGGGTRWDRCKKLLSDIYRLANELLKELNKYNPIEDAKGGHPYQHGSKRGTTKPCGHKKEIQNLQKAIKNRLRDFYKDCWDYENQPAKFVHNLVNIDPDRYYEHKKRQEEHWRRVQASQGLVDMTPLMVPGVGIWRYVASGLSAATEALKNLVREVGKQLVPVFGQ